MRWIKVSEFCKQEGVSHQGVYAKLNSYRYEQDLKDHVRGYKGKRELDETAVEILRPNKPTGTPKRSDLDEIMERLTVIEERTENISAAMDEIRLRKRVAAILRKHKAARLRKDGCAILRTCRSSIRNSKTTFSRWEKAIPILGKGGFSYKIASYERRYLLSEKPSQTAFRRDFQPLGPRYFTLYFSRSYRRKDDIL